MLQETMILFLFCFGLDQHSTAESIIFISMYRRPDVVLLCRELLYHELKLSPYFRLCRIEGAGFPGQALPWSGARLRAPSNGKGRGECGRCNAAGDVLAGYIHAKALPNRGRRGEGVRIRVLGVASEKRAIKMMFSLVVETLGK